VIVRFVLECPNAPTATPSEEHTKLDVHGELDFVRKVWQETVSLGWQCACRAGAMIERRYVLEPGIGIDGSADWKLLLGKDWDSLRVTSTLEKIEAAGQQEAASG